MFQNNTGSSWTNPQGAQQQQPPNAFGQPSGFGAGNAFGTSTSTNTFGQSQPQQQQQQQPQANPMFGGLGGSATTTAPSTGFGPFGGATNTANSGGLFGQPKPATVFSAFGNAGTTGTFGSTTPGSFGATNAAGPSTATNLFGNANAFGGGALFGAAKPTTSFGATPATGTTPVTTGSSSPAYAPFTEKEGTVSLHYQSITCMSQYSGSSLEELRVQDYQQGRKTAGGFGQTAFGGPTQQQQPTGLFGQTAQNNATPAGNSMFGTFGTTNSAANNSGTTGGFSTFGQPQNNAGTAGTGLFGGGSAFGQQNQQQQQQQQPTADFGILGQPQQQNAGGGLFGPGGTFGANNQQKPAGFATFGNAGTTSTFGGTGAFGQPQGQQLGQAAQQQPNTGAYGLGANNNAPKPGFFSQPAQQNAGSGTFGQQNQQQQQQPAQTGSSLFGGNTGGGGLFGNNNQQQQQQPGTGLFGQSAQQPATGSLFSGGGGGLFGNTNQNQNQQQQQQPAQNNSFGLFSGAKPTAPPTNTSGLFGSTFGQPQNNVGQTNTNPLFGSALGQPSNNQQNPNTFGSQGLFGPRPSTTPLGTAPSTGQQGTGLSGSLFGNGQSNMNTTLGQNIQSQFTASIAQPISTTLPIFSLLPPGPRAVPLDTPPKKKSGYFMDVPTRTPVPRLGLTYAPANSKLRGFTSTSQAPGTNSSSSNVLFGSSKPNALSLSKAANGKSVLGPEALLTGGSPSPALGSGGRQSVKKLILDKRVDPSDLFFKSTLTKGSKITFSPALSVAQREKEAAAAISRSSPDPRARDTPSPAPTRDRSTNHFTAQSTADVLHTGGDGDLQEGDYWMSPDLETLKRKSHEELVSLKGLVVGRKGYGAITFLEPVDLTNVPKLAGLLGELVRFDDKECSVYPDSDEAEKPPPGSGLNVKAQIELYRCWALDKATREPIRDERNPHAIRHFKRLKNMKHTHFESFDIEEGKWIFTVDHF